jgi:hypothetical protein
MHNVWAYRFWQVVIHYTVLAKFRHLCTEYNLDVDLIWSYSDKTADPSQQLAKILKRKISFNEAVQAEVAKARDTVPHNPG